MTALMNGADGAGLAATQVGVLRRVFVMRTGENGATIALVNPEIVEQAEELEADDEGCLSLQGLLLPVERPVSLTVAAKDPEGADITLELTGVAARACQHELDHLDGVLILDRTTEEARREAMARLRQRSAPRSTAGAALTWTRSGSRRRPRSVPTSSRSSPNGKTSRSV